MNIGERTIGRGHPPYIIAEIGVNHDGDPERLIELVQAAKTAGADAVKTQWFRADMLLSSAAALAQYQADAGATDAASMLRGLELHDDDYARFVTAAHALRLHAIVTVFSVELVERAARLPWDAFKTASPDVINLPLLAALAATGRPLIVSTGAATAEETARCANWLNQHAAMFMQCVSAYPTPDEDAALGGIRAIEQLTAALAGYSDHTTSIDTGALAVAAGACVLEKHLTHDRQARGPDHAASLDPVQFRAYVEAAHRAARMIGDSDKRLLPREREVRLIARQSLTTTHAMPRGHRLTAEDLTVKRPGTGLEPWRFDEVLGRALRVDLPANTPLTDEVLDG